MAANEKEINEQGEQFLHALRPKPTPPTASVSKKEPEKESVPQRCASKHETTSDDGAEQYMDTFIRIKSLNFRKGPGQALIHKDIHTVLNRIVNIIGDNEISVSQYVNNVLAQHLEQYSELITKLLTEKFQTKI